MNTLVGAVIRRHDLTMRCCWRAWCLVMLMLTLVGGHGAALQTVAWIGMVSARLDSQGVEGAIRSTFDGKHPCRLCLVAKQLREDRAPGKPQAPYDKTLKKSDLQTSEPWSLSMVGTRGVVVVIQDPFPGVVPMLPSPEPPPPKQV